MECLIVDPSDVSGTDLTLRGEEAHHAVRVLRLRVGDRFLATDLVGHVYDAHVLEIREVGRREAEVSAAIDRDLPEFGEPARQVDLMIGYLAQPARWEFLVEKATELGVHAIVPISAERVERREFKPDRTERILRAAVKQTKRARMPKLGELSRLSEALEVAAQQGRALILLHESAPLQDRLIDAISTVSGPLALIVGPEGGFSDEEVREGIRQGAKVVSLGERRLRAETAAIAALTIAQLT